MSAIKGPAIFLAQFVSDKAPFNKLDTIVKWAAENGYKGIQMPTGNDDIFNLELAANSQEYCDEVMGICRDAGIEITELSTHLQGQLVAVRVSGYKIGIFRFSNKQLSVNSASSHCIPSTLPLFHLHIYHVGSSLNDLGVRKPALTKFVQFQFLSHEVSSEASDFEF